MTSSARGVPDSRVIMRSLFRADLIVLIRNRRSLILSVLLPLLILVTTSAQKAKANLGGSLLIVGLAITYGLMATSMLGYALSVARDRDNGVFQRLRVTPARTWMIMSSRLGVQVVANLVIALIVLIVSTSIHDVTLNVTQYLLVLAVSILGGAVFLSIGQALVGLVKSSDTVNAAGRIVFIGLFFLGLFGLDGALGATFESAARWSPVGVVMVLFSGVMNLSAWTANDSMSILVCLAYAVVFTAIGIRWFSWQSQ